MPAVCKLWNQNKVREKKVCRSERNQTESKLWFFIVKINTLLTEMFLISRFFHAWLNLLDSILLLLDLRYYITGLFTILFLDDEPFVRFCIFIVTNSCLFLLPFLLMPPPSHQRDLLNFLFHCFLMSFRFLRIFFFFFFEIIDYYQELLLVKGL